MDRKKLFNTLAYLIIFIFLANFLANKFYWYSSIWYFDIIMHFLGGFWVGILALYILGIKSISWRTILKIIICVLAVGIGWEIFEAIVDKVVSKNPFNTLDSFSDIFFDVAGGTVSIFYYMKRIMKREPNRVQ
jgi:hypothetical protein